MNRTALLFLGLLAMAHLAGGEVPLEQDPSPTRVEISLSADHHNAHIAWLPTRGRAFELRVVPTFDGWNDVDSWEVQLFSAVKTGRDGRNLLAPAGNWHGLQPFDVLPGDIEGAGVYPGRRVIERGEFTCTIEVLGGAARPSRVTPGARIFDSLTLAVEIDLKSTASNAKNKQEPP
jgi:hypothetical protein